jgi:hypothetical protein
MVPLHVFKRIQNLSISRHGIASLFFIKPSLEALWRAFRGRTLNHLQAIPVAQDIFPVNCALSDAVIGQVDQRFAATVCTTPRNAPRAYGCLPPTLACLRNARNPPP